MDDFISSKITAQIIISSKIKTVVLLDHLFLHKNNLQMF